MSSEFGRIVKNVGTGIFNRTLGRLLGVCGYKVQTKQMQCLVPY
jgi:hypothetical protein